MVSRLGATYRLAASSLDAHYKKICDVLTVLGFTGLGMTIPVGTTPPTLRTPFTHWDPRKTEAILGKPFRRDQYLHYAAADGDALVGIVVDEANKVVTLKNDLNILEHLM